MGNGKGSRTTVYSIKCRHKVTIIAQQLLARRRGGGGGEKRRGTDEMRRHGRRRLSAPFRAGNDVAQQVASGTFSHRRRDEVGIWGVARRKEEKRGEGRKRKENIALCPIHFRNHRRESWWMPTWMIVVDLGGWYVRDMLSTIDMVVAPHQRNRSLSVIIDFRTGSLILNVRCKCRSGARSVHSKFENGA